MRKSIKKLLTLGLCLSLIGGFTACKNTSEVPADAPKQVEGQDQKNGQDDPKTATGDTQEVGKGKKVALLTDVAGTQVFVLDMIKGLKESAEKYGFELVVVECQDGPSFEDNGRALVEDGYDLIIGGGWQATDTMGKLGTEFKDRAQYALVDSVVDPSITAVKCISYREQEGAYLIGQLAALVTKDSDSNIFGGVHVNEGPGSFKWRWGYMEGIKSIRQGKPNKFIFNYVGSFNDPAKAKEYAIQQSAAGCQFVNAAAAGGDKGVFEAAKEKGFYTSGQDIDLTNPDNPYIVTSQIKDTRQTMINLMDEYFSGNWNTENEVWGIKEGAIGAVYVTHDSQNPRSDKLSDEDIALLKKTAEDIKSGKLDLSTIPDEASYKQ